MASKLPLLAIPLLIAGCNSTPVPSTVQQVGENQYTVSASMEGVKFDNEENSSFTRGKALEVANTYCKDRGSAYAELLRENISKGPVATSIIYFSCNK